MASFPERGLKTNIIFDGLYSASIGYFDEILKNKGIAFDSLHMFHDVNFGGGMPDPKPRFLKELVEKVKSTPNSIGLANDGDADRFGVINENGEKLGKHTLNEALDKEKDVHGLIIHSDQGFQYTSYEYKAICESNGIQISMSRKGTPIDDSPIESWHALLKKETLYNNNITSLQEYIQLVEEWILFYNTTRLKSEIKKKRKTYTKREK